MSSTGDQDGRTEPLSPQELAEIYSWIDAVPLSKQKKNIARDFSDGVAVAKIVQYYLPKMVELQMHNYVNAHSSPQKRINWGILNKKVFSKLNVKLDDKLVESAIEAKPGAIEQILFDLRKKVIELSPRTISTANLESLNQGRSIFRKTRSQVPSGGKKVPTQAFASVVAVPATPVPVPRQSRIPPKAAASTTAAKQNAHRAQVPPPPRRKSPARVADAKKVAQAARPKTGVKEKVQQPTNQEPDEPCVAPPQELESPVVCPSEVPEPIEAPQPEVAETTDGVPSGAADANANAKDDEVDDGVLPPAKLRYKGHDMVPEVMLEESRKQVHDMESIISSLTKKVNFLDNLIAQKDVRLEELNRQMAKSGNEVNTY